MVEYLFTAVCCYGGKLLSDKRNAQIMQKKVQHTYKALKMSLQWQCSGPLLAASASASGIRKNPLTPPGQLAARGKLASCAVSWDTSEIQRIFLRYRY